MAPGTRPRCSRRWVGLDNFPEPGRRRSVHMLMVRERRGQQVELKLDVPARLILELTLAIQGIDQIPLGGDEQQIDFIGPLRWGPIHLERTVKVPEAQLVSQLDRRSRYFPSSIQAIILPQPVKVDDAPGFASNSLALMLDFSIICPEFRIVPSAVILSIIRVSAESNLT